MKKLLVIGFMAMASCTHLAEMKDKHSAKLKDAQDKANAKLNDKVNDKGLQADAKQKLCAKATDSQKKKLKCHDE